MSIQRTLRNVSRPIAKRASRIVTLPTAKLRSLPDFLIIGAQRCGTTSLYRYLTRHPEVVPAVLNKGIHYFDTDPGKSVTWYRSHFPSEPFKALVARRRGVDHVVTGEASPYYVFHPVAPQRIADVLPDARSILILRDPIERAHSHYTHEFVRGFETLSFEDALECEAERLDGEEARMLADPDYYSFSHQHHSYAARGMYAEQVERWSRYFPKEQLMIVDANDLFGDPDSTFRAVLRFLGLRDMSLDGYEKMNAHSYSSMSAKARGFLEERFEQPNRALNALLERDLGWNGNRTA